MNNLIGNQGGAGSFHEAVTLQRYGKDAESLIKAYPTFPDMFEGLQSGSVGQMVMAIQNSSIKGSPMIAEPFELLTSEEASNYWIVGEEYLSVEHHLLGVEGARISDIKEVHSQLPALAQCDKNLSRLLPHVLRVEQEDTAISAKYVAEKQDRTIAAIASNRAAEIHGLFPIMPNLQDSPHNTTRFLIVEKRTNQKPQPEDNKSTLQIATAQHVGALVDALTEFKNTDINTSWIQPTMMPDDPFKMQFFVEVDAGQQEDKMIKAMHNLAKQCLRVTVLGSYKSGTMPRLKG